MTIPPYLKPGDLIGITCPASKMDRKVAEYACDIIISWGFRVKMGKTVGTNFHNFSAPNKERLEELQKMLDDDEIKAILFGRGGYGLLRIIDQLDFFHFKKHSKWICGYSDITALLIHIYKMYGIVSLHSMMCSGITPETHDDEYVKSLRNALTGEKANYHFQSNKLNRKGICKGELIGGNLSLLASLSGSVSQPDTKGKILFLEDTGEYRYGVDRMMLNLKRAGWLDNLNGLLIGSFTDSKETDEPFGQTEYEIILDKVKEYNYPVAFGFSAGHQKENYALRIGGEYEMKVEDFQDKSCLCELY